MTMRRLIAVADTDSYLKWSSATLGRLSADWTCSQFVIANPVMPSADQMRAASGQEVPVLGRRSLLRQLRREEPDAVLLAATGPVVADLSADRAFRARGRPVLITGLPGISVPATRAAIRHRAGCDLFVLHSHREVQAFTGLAAALGVRTTFALARLPFLSGLHDRAEQFSRPRTDLVFAAQAKVPAERSQREAILLALARTPGAVVKLRARADEQQTHRERWSYPELAAELHHQGRLAAGSIRFATGSMADALQTARGLVTVSSTAALEAMAAEVPTLLLTDFGVSEELINVVFERSGCFGTLADLEAGRLNQPTSEWLIANYFHPPRDDDWLDRLDGLLAQRAATGLTPPQFPRSSWRSRVRRRTRLLVPAAARPAARRVAALARARLGRDDAH